MTASSLDLTQLDERLFRLTAVRRLLAAPAGDWDASAPPSDFDLNPQARVDTCGQVPRNAAVLVAVLAGDPLRVLLTERTMHLPAHAGQIAFPGGKIDGTDAGPLEAAIREAREEIGLEKDFIEPLGYLEPYRTGTGFLITPVVALIRPGYALCPDAAEVASIFEVPLAFLFDERNHRIDTLLWRGAERRYYAMDFEGRYIWGATAGIIRALHRRLMST